MTFNSLTRRGFLATAGTAWSIEYTVADRLPKDIDSLPKRAVDAEPDWAIVREAFSLPDGLVYMNNGSLGPCPGFVKWRALNAWDRLERNPVREAFGPLQAAADELARHDLPKQYSPKGDYSVALILLHSDRIYYTSPQNRNTTRVPNVPSAAQ